MTDYLETNGARIAYDVAGSGEPVLLVHAGVANRSMWDDQVEALRDAYRVIRHDTRGFGETETEAVPFSNRADIGGAARPSRRAVCPSRGAFARRADRPRLRARVSRNACAP